MHIQWYPGHMHKASKEIKEVLPKIDLIIEILDARIPFSSENPMIASLRGEKPCIKILNKSDLADPEKTKLWQQYLEMQRNVKTLALSIDQPAKVQQLTELCQKLVPSKLQKGQSIHCMIMGIPNVGKSTIINILAGKSIAKTGNEPAVTKQQQRINLGNGIILSDTPGVLWPNVENPNSGYRLACTGAIKDTAMQYDDVAFYAANYLTQHYAERLSQRYQLQADSLSEQQLLEAIGTQRGCLRSGGQVDMDKTGKIFLNELRNGTLGRLTLETPSMMEKELAEVAILREQKAAKKAARLLRRKKRR